jgi:hypothetical protein
MLAFAAANQVPNAAGRADPGNAVASGSSIAGVLAQPGLRRAVWADHQAVAPAPAPR